MLAEIRAAAEYLTLSVSSELSSLTDPEAREGLTADLERRKEEAQDALQQTALWQQVLNDGIADLTADIDHDLRNRFRVITQHTEKVIDSCDPTVHWAEIGSSWRTRWPPPSGTTSSGPTSAPRRLRRRWPARSSKPAWTRSRCPSSVHDMGDGFGEFKSLASLEPSRFARATGWFPACADPSEGC